MDYNERISRKQQNYEKAKAYDVIDSLKAKSLSNQEILSCIDIMMLLDDQSETQMGVLIIAKRVITGYIEQEISDASNIVNLTSLN